MNTNILMASPVLELFIEKNYISNPDFLNLKQISREAREQLSSSYCKQMQDKYLKSHLEKTLKVFLDYPKKTKWKDFLFQGYPVWDDEGEAPLKFHAFYQTLCLIQTRQTAGRVVAVDNALLIAQMARSQSIISRTEDLEIIKYLENQDFLLEDLDELMAFFMSTFSQETIVLI